MFIVQVRLQFATPMTETALLFLTDVALLVHRLDHRRRSSPIQP
jgi:hypothetical protein